MGPLLHWAVRMQAPSQNVGGVELDGSRSLRRSSTAMDYLEGQGDLVSGLIMGIKGVTIWVIIGVITLLTKSP